MMSGPELASTAAAVVGCSWSPVTVSMATVTPLAAPHSAAWRLNSSSAGLTKLVHCSSRIDAPLRSEEHTSELQSQSNLVCRLLLEKKKKKTRKEVVSY